MIGVANRLYCRKTKNDIEFSCGRPTMKCRMLAGVGRRKGSGVPELFCGDEGRGGATSDSCNIFSGDAR